jgi:hypothetical protein
VWRARLWRRMGYSFDRSQARLLEAARSANPQAIFDLNGYAAKLNDNLIEGVSREQFEPDYASAAGRELEGKMRAAYSSAALVVNTFARWRKDPSNLLLASMTGFNAMRFEAVFPTGLGGTPPHLDLVGYGPKTVAVESKCLEYLTPKKAVFSRAYDTITDARRDSPWFKLIDLLRRAPCRYQYLDAAQLVKHALGLMRAPISGNLVLLYLYWEPLNRSEFDDFKRHREEVEDLHAIVHGARPEFKSIPYSQMWEEWSKESGDTSLKGHLGRLQERYAIVI